MKTLLLLALLPFSSNAMDPSWQRWINDTIRDMTPYAKQAAFDFGCKALSEIQKGISQAAANRAYRRSVESEEIMFQQAQLNKQKEEANVATQAAMMSDEEKTGQEFDRCLNEHVRCRDLTSLGIPPRCNSPARRYSLYNQSAAQARIALFKKRTQGGAASYKVETQ